MTTPKITPEYRAELRKLADTVPAVTSSVIVLSRRMRRS